MSKIKEKISDYKDAIIGNAIYDIVKFILISLIGSSSTSILYNIFIDFLDIDILTKYRIPITFFIVVFTLFIILEVYTKNFKHHPTTPPVESDYSVTKREIFFIYGKDASRYELYLNVRSEVKNLNRIYGKYTWSGSEEATLRCETRHCNLIPLTRKDSFIEYEIELKKNYKKGRHVECKIVGDLPDSKHTFIPFFASRITEETRELIINICIPPEYNVKEVICEEIAIVRNSNQNSEVKMLDAQGNYKWVIKHPKLFYKYSVRWEL